MNTTILSGRLTKDPDVRHTQDDKCIARFTLAVDRRFKKDEADFISCVAFGKTAEFIEKYLQKGTKIIVEGRIQTGSYTDKNDKKVYTTDVVVEQVEFAESKRATVESQPPLPIDEFISIPDGVEDEGLPFN
jgi:single-strand DNA-binding protein